MYSLVKTYYPYFQFKKATKPSKGVIFFIHGYAVNSSYHNFFSDLLDDYDYYAVELPGHGITPLKDKNQLRPIEFAKEVASLIQQLNLKDIYLIGHSMGGGISVMVSQLIPQLIKKMVIVTPMNSKGTTNVFNFLFHFNPKNDKQIEKFYKILLYDYPNQKSLLTEDMINGTIDLQKQQEKNFTILRHHMASISNMNACSKNEKNIPVKTLLLVGSGDGCINPKTTIKNFKKKNKDIEVYQFLYSGHLPFFEETKLYYQKIMDFITKDE